jgi:hypothetical protein
MARRLELHALLLDLAKDYASVYFQPPASIVMQYPFIVYNRFTGTTIFADGKPYKHTKRYQLTIIDGDPDGPLNDLVSDLPMCTYNRSFTTDNLNHDVYNIYF